MVVSNEFIVLAGFSIFFTVMAFESDRLEVVMFWRSTSITSWFLCMWLWLLSSEYQIVSWMFMGIAFVNIVFLLLDSLEFLKRSGDASLRGEGY